MSKITNNERINALEQQVKGLIEGYKILSRHVDCASEYKPQLKQLDQSVFDGLDEKWRFAVMQSNGYVIVCNQKPFLSFGGSSWDWNGHNIGIGTGYDASNWQNSLIERDKVDLTGSDLCRAMLERGDKIVTCAVKNYEDELDSYDAIIAVSSNGKYYESTSNLWSFAVPINNQGEPLTQSEAGL